MKYKTVLFLSMALVMLNSSYGGEELNLSERHPNEPADYTFNKRFSYENSMFRVRQIREFMDNIHTLLEKKGASISPEESKVQGSIGFEFVNWIGAVEGTLKKQDYMIKKLEFECAAMKYKTGEISKDELESKEKLYKQSENDFKSFWDSFIIID
ncbi:hypothetical protein LLG96_08680 [bacterium]|nr:hypothetical protein [bacterium]